MPKSEIEIELIYHSLPCRIPAKRNSCKLRNLLRSTGMSGHDRGNMHVVSILLLNRNGSQAALDMLLVATEQQDSATCQAILKCLTEE